MGEKSKMKSVEAKSSHQMHKSGQFTCSYCTGDHRTVDGTKYKTINARKDHIIAQRLCFNCLGVGHSSKTCKSTRTCSICHLHHHTSLCNQQSNNNNNNNSSNSNRSDSSSMQKTSPLNHVVVVTHNLNRTSIHHNNNNRNP